MYLVGEPLVELQRRHARILGDEPEGVLCVCVCVCVCVYRGVWGGINGSVSPSVGRYFVLQVCVSMCVWLGPSVGRYIYGKMLSHVCVTD